MILTLVGTWGLMFLLALYSNLNYLLDIILPNLSWFLFFFPYFSIKIYKISKKLASKKEEAIIEIFEKKTKNISEIELITGIEKGNVLFYLKKNGYRIENKKETENQFDR